MKEYTEHLVRARQLLTMIEDIMLNDRDVARAKAVSHELVIEVVDLCGVLTPVGSLGQNYWTPRQVDADTTGSPPLGTH